MTAYAAYYDVSERVWKVLSFDVDRARQIGSYLCYLGMIYGPAAECYTDHIGAELWIQKEYGAARKYQKTLAELRGVA